MDTNTLYMELVELLMEDPYEGYVSAAPMRRSAKTNKRGINVVLNCGTERSIHHSNSKVRK